MNLIITTRNNKIYMINHRETNIKDIYTFKFILKLMIFYISFDYYYLPI